MHFVNHNFTDIDFETKHMSRIEKTVYFDLRSLYLSEEKPIDASDMGLLQRRLTVKDEDEKAALVFVLKDKFTSSKAGKQYNQPAWDKVIKDYKFQQISTALGDMSKRLRAAGVTIEANAGMSAIRELYINRFGSDKLTRITNKANVMTNEANDKANVMTNDDEYKLTSNDERKHMVDSLKSVGESVTLKTSITTLRELYTKRFNSDSKVDATNAIYKANDMTNTNANAMTNIANVMTNEINAENDAITINHEPVTNNHKPVSERDAHTNTGEMIIETVVDNFSNDSSSVDNSTDSNQPVPVETETTQPPASQPVTQAEQIRDQRASDIENWEAPIIDQMRGELFRAGKMMQLTDDQYSLHVEEFKAHYAEQALLGKPISTESNRKAKLRKWLSGEVDKAAATQARQDKAKGTFNIDNEDWSGTTASQSKRDSDIPDVFHPSHSKPDTVKRDPKTSVVVNGLLKDPLPGIGVMGTYEYIKTHKMPGEMADETYNRLLNEMQEAV